jgi:hypothetical protein
MIITHISYKMGSIGTVSLRFFSERTERSILISTALMGCFGSRNLKAASS